MIYLDHAATAPVRRGALEAMWPYLTGEFGNPSSHHELGERAAVVLGGAGATVARFLGARPGDVTFTSGGTEADNLGIKGMALATPRGRHLVTTRIEHEAVLESCAYLERLHGFTVSFAEVDGSGILTPSALAEALRDDTTLVAIGHANNEIGTVQPVVELAAAAHAIGARMHVDAVQSAPWLPLAPIVAAADSVAIAGHKLGAPKGVGALAVRGLVEPLVHGGGQERGRRSGTEDVAGSVGLAAAVAALASSRAGSGPGSHDAADEPAVVLRDALIDGVLGAVPGAVLTGARTPRLPGHASFCFPGASGEAVLLELERHGIVCSSGSACAAGSDDPSHVLVALGIDPVVAQTAVRFTFDATTSRAEIDETIARTADAVRGLSALGR